MASAAGIRAGRAGVELFTDDSKFRRGIAMASARLRAFGSGIMGIGASMLSMTGIGGVLGGLLGGLGFVAGIKGALDFGSALTDLQNRTGGSFESLQILKKAFDITGVGAEQVGPAINRLQKILAAPTDNQTAAIEGLGLSFNDLLMLDPGTQFQKVGAAIAAIQNPAQRTAAAVAIFGKSGGGLLALFGDSDAFALSTQLLGNQVEIFARMAPMFDYLSDVFGSWPDKLRGLWAGVADGLSPVLIMAANWFAGLDLSGFGQRVGTALTDGFMLLKAAFAQGQLGELLSAELTVAFSRLADLFENLFPVIAQGFVAMFYALGPVLAGVVKSALATPIKSTADALILGSMKENLGVNVKELERLKGLRGLSPDEMGTTPEDLESRIASLATEVDVAAGAIRDYSTTATPGEAERRAKEQAELSASLSGLFGTLRGVVGGVKSGAQVVSDETKAAMELRDKLRSDIMAKATKTEPFFDWELYEKQWDSAAETAAMALTSPMLSGASLGTFSGFAADRLGDAGPVNRIAAATEETAKNTTEIKDKLGEGAEVEP